MNFWIYLLLVNVIIFLPFYFLNFKVQPNPLYVLTSPEVSLENKLRIPYSKRSSDPFRIYFEFTALLLVFKYLGITANWAIVICAIVGVLGWVLIIYAGVMRYVFYRPPVFHSDWQLVKIGLKMTYSQRYLIYGALVLLLLLMGGLCFGFARAILNAPVEVNYIPWVLLVLSPLALIKTFRVKYSKLIYRTVVSTVMYTYRNWKNSRQFYFPLGKERDYFIQKSPCQSLELQEKPNLSMIGIESYGSVVFHDKEMRRAILPILEDFENRLGELGYSMVSGMSISPLIGGGSWKCYSSFTYGMRIDDDSLYSLLFRDIDNFESYKSIFHLLKDEGYTNYLLCPMGNNKEGTVDWELLRRNLQSDIYLEYEDMEYTGESLKFFGDTKIPPDQYSINKALEIIKSKSDDPYFLFFVSLNSHYPFVSPTKMVDDWRDLNNQDIDIGVMKKRSEKLNVMYTKAIAYQLEVFLKYIEDSEEPLFVLFGDHQPPMTKLPHGLRDTPVHIIAKNKKLVEPFLEQGFEEGLIPSLDPKKSIRHEGFLSLFAAAMQEAYGGVDKSIVRYQPKGTDFTIDGQTVGQN